MDDELELMGINDVELLRTLEQRSLGNCKKVKGSPFDLQIHAEDVFIHKEFDELRCDIPDIPRSTFLMVFSPDGTKIASTHGNHNIYVTDSRTGKNIRTLSGHPRTPWCIAFHPTSNQILASGCLGGQVRIWDLSGGSEIWTSDITSVIASIAFHPDDRLLVIATCNELHFWDWTKPEPFMSVSTGNIKEKVRYVAFSKEGTKLITGISNNPQMRWERVRAPVPVSRQTDGSANSYRRRITPRLVSIPISQAPSPPVTTSTTTTTTTINSTNSTNREPLSTVPERERRITACYRNLVREYELLVQRYLQVYRPPTMIDQGTDPMEEEIDLSTLAGISSNTRTSATNTTSTTQSNTNTLSDEPQASTSSGTRPATSTPRRYGASKPISTIGTQTSSTLSIEISNIESSTSPSVSTTEPENSPITGLHNTCFGPIPDIRYEELNGRSNQNNENNLQSTNQSETEANATTQTDNPRRVLIISTDLNRSETESNSTSDPNTSPYKVRIKCNVENNTDAKAATSNVQEAEEPKPSTSGFQSKLPLKSPRHKYDHSRKRSYSGLLKKNRRPVLDTSTDSSSSSDEQETYSKRKCTESRSTSTPTNPTTTSPPPETNTFFSRQPLNFNRKLEMLVTDLLQVDSQHRHCPNTENSDHSSRICSTCGLRIPDYRRSTEPNIQTPLRTTESDSTAATSSSPTFAFSLRPSLRPTSPRSLPRPTSHRFFSHRYSAFNPTRVMQLRSTNRLSSLRSPRPSSPSRRNWLRSFHAFHRSRNFASDELINYSERVNEEETQEVQQQPNFHPFDPPPEFATINPENIGIGNMYSNIVQELESSLNDVRNLRPGNRLGETSDMLSSFSERLESIMNQSNAILRNLRTSIETLTPERNNSNTTTPSTNTSNSNQNIISPAPQGNEPQVHFSDMSFYLRDQNNESPEIPVNSSNLLDEAENIFANQRAAVADHTYPVNSRNSSRSLRYMSPLMASLHLTVSHIQRQARLLRQQVESIERIDRAMLEVAQLQMLRQMFTELQRHFRSRTENRHAVSSVRQMMAGARISDSSPYDSPEENSNSQNSSSDGPSRPNPTTSEQNPATAQARAPRKNFPRCIFLMHRNVRRGPVANILHRRLYSRDRLLRRQLFRRGFNCRTLLQQSSVDLLRQSNATMNTASMEVLRSLIRRLEYYLMEHGQNIGIVVSPTRNSTVTPREEFSLMFRLNECRTRIISHVGFNHSINRQSNSVTADGASRFSAREILTTAAERLIRYIMFSSNQNYLRPLISDILDLSLLLSEILLLQIVDSIPPPSGMNLDTERESLSVRIDHMCSRMLSRLNDNSQALTRSLRLTRLAVRQASNALNQTYRARRNAMLPSSFRDPRRTLLEEIHTCLRNIRRHETLPTGSNTNQLSTSDWFQTIHRLISRHRNEALGLDQPGTSGVNLTTNQSNNANNDNQQNDRSQVSSTNNNNNDRASSDDDNDNSDRPPSPDESNITRALHVQSSPYVSPHLLFSRPRPPSSNIFNLLNDEDSTANNNTSSRSRSWNAPIIQVNDEPVSQSQLSPIQSFHSYLTNRQRLSERFAELRTYPVVGLFRPRFLHPLYSGAMDNDLDESVRDQLYDTSDMMTPVTPNHRIQVWDFSQNVIPNISDPLRNMVVNECKIHNDASVDIASDGSILVTLLPTGGYLNGTTRLGVYSLEWETLGQCLYVANLEQNAVSVSLSPLNRHLVVGLAARRVSIVPSERWIMARIFALDDKRNPSNQLVSTREVAQIREPNSLKSVNCIRWLPVSGQGLVYGTNTGQLRILT